VEVWHDKSPDEMNATEYTCTVSIFPFSRNEKVRASNLSPENLLMGLTSDDPTSIRDTFGL